MSGTRRLKVHGIFYSINQAFEGGDHLVVGQNRVDRVVRRHGSRQAVESRTFYVNKYMLNVVERGLMSDGRERN